MVQVSRDTEIINAIKFKKLATTTKQNTTFKKKKKSHLPINTRHHLCFTEKDKKTTGNKTGLLLQFKMSSKGHSFSWFE